ncbi:MAG: HIT domain-containing protein, partial [Bacillota bacterium]|nr:HIT domain-containing protein [Bacillota bacterium]
MDNCIFCKIISGDIPSSVLYEDEAFKVIMDISPAAKGHAIIIPKKHFANLFELEDDFANKLLIVAKKVAKAMKKELE